MKPQKTNSRERILIAAEEVARNAGPGSLSLDAIAQRAGVSKGGLLYNFPTKAKLLQGLVEKHLEEFEKAIDEGSARGEPLLSSYLRVIERSSAEGHPPAAWLFSAIAEDPGFLEPINQFRGRLLARLRAQGGDLGDLLIAFMAMEGLQCMKLFDTDLLSPQERAVLLERAHAIAAGQRV
ncbi:TetR/AcrR family transcriptional regulator [Aquibium carbonis]|uniref:TetR/AcrR family transcriptional regulator n=1 Tax=Aquibium carbonis TaxID=2495581 RepID=A0A429YU63_9HYPH|nr:TetR/AcrR family transcriptional regulator [Aquibium carbonis]RST84942.1 TetR/AcrR family transcriptional regulator [Aquibium carbonis]